VEEDLEKYQDALKRDNGGGTTGRGSSGGGGGGGGSSSSKCCWYPVHASDRIHVADLPPLEQRVLDAEYLLAELCAKARNCDGAPSTTTPIATATTVPGDGGGSSDDDDSGGGGRLVLRRRSTCSRYVPPENSRHVPFHSIQFQIARSILPDDNKSGTSGGGGGGGGGGTTERSTRYSASDEEKGEGTRPTELTRHRTTFPIPTPFKSKQMSWSN